MQPHDHQKYPAKPLLNSPIVFAPDTTIQIDGGHIAAEVGEPLITAINRAYALKAGPAGLGKTTSIPQVCYLEPMGKIGTCDTCMVELNGELVRSCEAHVAAGQQVLTRSDRADVAQRVAFDNLLENHNLYCTVCDNNNGNCTVHNATAELNVIHQAREFRHRPYAQDWSNPFYRYDPDQCILCGRCVEACQNVQVNETLTISWDREFPRVMWDGGEPSKAQAVSAAATASRSVPATHSWKRTWCTRPAISPRYPLPCWTK